MYLSRIEQFKNQKVQHHQIEEEDDINYDEEERLSVSSSTKGIRNRYEKQPYNNHTHHHLYGEEEYPTTTRTVKLNQYGIPDVIPSNLGDSFAAATTKNINNNEEEDMTNNTTSHGRRGEGMMGLLNQFYDLNNNPTL